MRLPDMLAQVVLDVVLLACVLEESEGPYEKLMAFQALSEMWIGPVLAEVYTLTVAY